MGSVLVLGCHRSGTSLVSGVIDALGFDMGGLDSVPADKHNQKGYFECRRSNNLLEYSTGFPPSYCGTPDGNGTLPRWREYVVELCKAKGDMFGLKETRLVYHPNHVRAWAEVVGEPPLCVFVSRNKASVVKSLAKYMGERPDNLVYTEAAQQATHMMYLFVKNLGYPVLGIQFEEFVKRPGRQVERLARFLGVEVTEKALAHFDRGLVHNG